MYYETDYLAHYGVLGMKWGVRRYQNKDGSLTSKGKAHREEKKDSKRKDVGTKRLDNRVETLNKDIDKKSARLGMRNIKNAGEIEKNYQYVKKVSNEIKNDPERLSEFGKRTIRKRAAAITAETTLGSIGLGAGVAALAAAEAEALIVALPATAIAIGAEYCRRLTYK